MPVSCLKGFNNATPLDPRESKEHLLEKVDTAHDMWRKERGEDIQTILTRLYNPEVYVKTQTGYPKGLSGQFEPELASFFEVKYSYPSLCESRKYGKADWTIREVMEDFSEDEDDPSKNTFWNADDGPVKNEMITTIQLTMPSGDEKKRII